jgi:hypothetical protein
MSDIIVTAVVALAATALAIVLFTAERRRWQRRDGSDPN